MVTNSPLNIIPVDTISDDRLVKFSYRREAQLRPSNEMVIDSEKVVCRAIQNGARICQILASQNYYTKYEKLFTELPDSTLLYVATPEMMHDIVGHRIHQGMMAIAERPSLVSLDQLGDKILCINRSTDASNVGAMMRNAHALNYDSVIFDVDACHPYARRAVRVSMGSVFSLRVHQSLSLTESLLHLRQKGYQIISTGLWDDAVSLSQTKFSKRNVLVIGNEDKGVDRSIYELSDLKVKIDLAPTVNSLNAACASAIMMYEAGKGTTSRQ